MIEPPHVRLDRADGVVTITLDRAATKNGVRPQDWSELHRVLHEVDKNPHDRAIILTGANGTFCSGADLGSSGDDGGSPLSAMRIANEACVALREVSQPTIAKVSGYAVGAGFNLMLACDLIIADDTAKFSQIFTRRGMSLDCGGSWYLAQALGLQRAKEIAFFGDFLTASQGLELGLLNRVVAQEELDAVVDDWARRLCDLPPIALARTKRLLNTAPDDGFSSILHQEAMAQEFNATTHDTKEAIEAFLEKRPARFRGN